MDSFEYAENETAKRDEKLGSNAGVILSPSFRNNNCIRKMMDCYQDLEKLAGGISSDDYLSFIIDGNSKLIKKEK